METKEEFMKGNMVDKSSIITDSSSRINFKESNNRLNLSKELKDFTDKFGEMFK